MDQGTQAQVTPSSAEVEEEYRKIRESFIRNEEALGSALATAYGEKNPNNMIVRAVPLMEILKGDQKNTRIILEWIKETLDVKEARIEAVLTRLTQFLDENEPLLKQIKQEREKYLAPE